MITPPNDPLFRYQWFLSNTGQSGGGIGSDINVLPLWPDYTGKGVRVAIVDDGVQLNHPDLAANIDRSGSWDAVRNVPGGDPFGDENHGTPVAGLVGAVANNGIGGSGVAPDATLLAYRINLNGKGGTFSTIAFQKALENQAAVVSNSWGVDTAFAENRNDPTSAAFYASLDALGSQGRDGKGAIVLFANGNRGASNFEGNLDNVTNSRYVITVGAVDDTGARAAYSTPGANLLVSSPAGGFPAQAMTRPGTGVLSTDRTSSDGYNTLFGPSGDWAYNFDGTSAATPIASGVVALVLQANPNLGYRDVQEILAHSARFVDVGTTGWRTTHASSTPWNGGGALFSRDYGFGEIDAHGAVRMAEIYPYLHSTPASDANVLLRTASVPVNVTIDSNPDSGEEDNTTFGLSLPAGVDLNHLDLTLFASVARPSNLTVGLKSPSGTTITMISNPVNAVNSAGEPIAWPTGGFTMGTNAFWGEESGGNWLVNVRIEGTSQVGTVLSATLTGYGDATSTEKDFVYTDSLGAAINLDTWQTGSTTRTTLKVAAGETAVIDAAAVSGAVSVNLSPTVRQAVIAGQAINIDAGTRVTKVFSGDGNDTLVGDASDNALLAGRGVNALDGGAGVDTELFIGSRAGYSVNYNAAGVLTASSLKGTSTDTAVRIEKATFTEGTLFVQAASDAGLDIAAYYQGLLFRPIDANGYLYWTNTAVQGGSVAGIGAAFQGSAEFANGAGKLGNAAYVDAVYQQMLHRAPDAAGAAYWTQQLASGAQTRAAMVVAIEHSPEYATTQLVGTFKAINDLGNLWS
jgi:subtilisin-like proprotein convertase family protein